MAEVALKAGIWVQAQIRVCDKNALPAVVVRRGNPDAGTILLKLNRFDAGYEVLTQVRTAEGNRAWMRSIGDNPVQESEADAYIERQLKFDPDIWVLEIEDSDCRNEIDGEVSEPLFGTVDQVVAKIGLYHIADGVDVEAESGLLEFRNHISAFERAQIAAAIARRAFRMPARQFGEISTAV